MASSKIFVAFEKRLPSAVLQVARFGRSESSCMWLEAKQLSAAAALLKSEFGMDFLENMSVMQVDDALAATYFVRGSTNAKSGYGDAVLIFRVTVELERKGEVSLQSVARHWPTAAQMEAEAAELFGIGFVEEDGAPVIYEKSKLPERWKGFPLRKKYVFPDEVDGIVHSRAWPDEGGENGTP